MIRKTCEKLCLLGIVELSKNHFHHLQNTHTQCDRLGTVDLNL